MFRFLCLLIFPFLSKALAGGPGSWGPVTPWPLIPVGVFHLDDGRLLGFAALQEDHYGVGGIPFSQQNYTQAAIWDPVTGSFEEIDLNGHDIFCPGMTFLPNGDVVAAGGGNGPNTYRVTVFEMATKSWSRKINMQGGHWYGTAVATNREVVIMEGTARMQGTTQNNFIPERSSGFDFNSPWTLLPDASFEDKINTNPAWYPQAHLMPNGKIFVSGTTNDMYIFDISGNGSLTFAGQRSSEPASQAWGASTLMYRPGQLMAVGGVMGWVEAQNEPTTSLSRAIKIDIRNAGSIATSELAPMNYGRGFQNAVLGPDGKVYVFGGNQIGKQFNDRKSILIPEVYNPTTNTWTDLTPMQTPRNYHSTAILLRDGTIFVGGGGLCGSCPVNHPDHEIFYPPYLYTNNGNKLAPRPEISSIPGTALLGSSVSITVSGPKADKIKSFMWMRFYSVTHSLSTDQRGLKRRAIPGSSSPTPGEFVYSTPLPRNVNVMPRGLYWVFAVTGGGLPSIAVKVLVSK